MGAPLKEGLDYYPTSTTTTDDEELLIIELGLEAYAVFQLLLKKIYLNGYFIKFQEDNLLLFSKKIGSKPEFVEKVVTVCIKRNLLSKKQYENNNILTSNEIQEQYLKICKSAKRKDYSINKEYSELIPKIDEENQVNTECIKNDTGILQNNTGIIQEVSTQRKEETKDIKIKESFKAEKEKKSLTSENSEPYKIAKRLLHDVSVLDKVYKQPNMENWAKEIERLIRIDNRKPDDIIRALNYIKEDTFWRTVILSPTNLRKHFKMIAIKMLDDIPNSAAPRNEEHEEKVGIMEW